MDIHSITLANIGPFVGENIVDFDDLSKAGLFLLEGPTGSGKSTVLDAIVFALYGAMASSAAGVDRMRADLAAVGDDSFVELVFEVNAGVFRVRRNPAYERPKKSGEGTTIQKAGVSLWRLATPDDDAGTLLSAKSHEADLEIYRAIGLTRAQFVQTVLLPQGEFAAFLRATPTERQTLLQRLFNTELYDKMAADLDAHRRGAVATRGQAQEELEHAVTAFVTAAELDEEAAAVVRATSIAELPDAVAHHLGIAKAQLEVSRSTHAEVQTRTDAADLALRNAQAHNEKLQTLRELDERKARLSEQATLQRARETTRLNLRAAKELSPYWRAVTDATTRVEELTERLAGAEAELRDDEARDVVTEWLTDPLAAAEGLNTTARALAPAAADAQRIDQLRADCAQTQARLNDAETNQEPIVAELAQLPAAIESLRDKLDAAKADAANIDLLTSNREAAATRLARAKEAERIATRIEIERGEVAKLKAAAKEAEREYSQAQRARIAGIAAELAAELDEEQPCPVCGSRNHPAPAKPGPTSASAAMVQAAAERAANAVEELERAAEMLATSDRELAAAQGAAKGTSVTECDAELSDAQAALESATQSQGAVEGLELERHALEQTAERLNTKLTTLKEQVVSLGESVARATITLTETDARIEAAKGNYPTVAERIDALDRHIAKLRSIAQLRSELASSKSSAAERQGGWENALAESPLPDVAAFTQAREQLSELDTLNEQIDAYNAEFHYVTTSLARTEFEGLDMDAAPVELAPLSAALQTCQSELLDATQQLGLHTSRFDSVARHAKLVNDQLRAVGAVIAETETAIRLAEIINATSPENQLRVPLPTYVLVTRFKEVLAAANDRLATMSDGRYSIEYFEERESHGRKSGLGISILDRHTERLRPAGDLSGGESFYTSLALALGLADVVVQEAGGVELGTLFIDEGFGTLDSATLDAVLAEIGRLRSGGRTVGLVSHVDELKQRISERIEVRRAAPGTSTLTVIA